LNHLTGRINMSFLDNLENNLKALESREEKDPAKVKRDQERQAADRDAARARAPHAEALKTSAFTGELLTQCRVVGHTQRVLVRFTWLGETLRLDAKEKRMELVPTPQGIEAVYSVDGAETKRHFVDPAKEDAAKLVKGWLEA
jgi:hypothetical protein